MYELTPVDRDELASEGSGTKLRAEGNLVYFMQKVKCEICLLCQPLTRPLSRSLRGQFICRIEVLELKSNLTIIVLLAETKEIDLS
jgi:hypothetical protein